MMDYQILQNKLHSAEKELYDFNRRTCENCRNLFGCATFKFVEYEYDEDVTRFGCTSWVSKQ